MEDRIRKDIATYDRCNRIAWHDRFVYAEYLAQTYYYTSHTTRLLAAAGSLFEVEREKLHQRFLKHAAEERGHHLLATRDLSKLGFSLGDFPELPTTSAFYETQYYRINRQGPIALFGYILGLEGTAVTYGPRAYEAARAAHGDAATSFLRVHAEEDPGHLETAFGIIRSLPPEEQELARVNTRFVLALYDSFLRSIEENAETRRVSGFPGAIPDEELAATA